MATAGAKRIVVVGGVAGGASAATRLRRLSEQAEIILLERGEHVSFANCGMPYHIGGAIADRQRLLVQTPEGLQRRYRIDVRTRSEVTEIDRAAKAVVVRDLTTGRQYREPYDALVLSPGAEPVRPPIAGAEGPGVFALRTLDDMDRIKRLVDQQTSSGGPSAAGGAAGRAVVIGGGYIGLEMTEALRERGLEVSLVELADQVFVAADAEMVAPIHQQLLLHGVDLRLGQSLTSIERPAAGDGQAMLLHLSNGQTIEAALVVMAVGVRPEVTLARQAGLEIGKSGGIQTDEHMRTSDADIYAVGDAAEVTHLVGGQRVMLPLAGPANRQGRIAADNIFGRPSQYRGSQGTAICKVFDLAIGMTGMSEKILQRNGRPYEKVYVHPSSHAGYYPGATQMSLKLLFDPASGEILGAQAVGASGVDKRIDVLAVAIRGKLTVHDLRDQELSYAPPYGSAKDPVNYAGFVAANVIDGDAEIVHAAELAHLPEGVKLIDVRTPQEVQAGTIPGSINIPLDDLRQRLNELSKDEQMVVFCQVGMRGYLAARILEQHGFKARNLSGGYKTWQAFMSTSGEMNDQPLNEARSDTGEMAPVAATGAPQSGCCGETPQAAAGEVPEQQVQVVEEIDAMSLQCPGPIMRLSQAIKNIDAGQAVRIKVGDAGFLSDVKGWCHSTGNSLLELAAKDKAIVAVVRKGGANSAGGGQGAASAGGRASACGSVAGGDAAGSQASSRKKSLVVFSGDFDKAMAAFIIANGAAAMGSEVTMFFTFWGLNILRRPESVKVRKNIIEKMFGRMMPRGAERLGLSRMNMGGMGLRMIKGIMRRKNVSQLSELIESAQAAGVKLVACTMSMDLMGIKQEELIDGIEEGGVAMYLDNAERGTVNLFI